MAAYHGDYKPTPITTKPWSQTDMHDKQTAKVIDGCNDLIRVKVEGGWLYMVQPFRGSVSAPAFVSDSEAPNAGR